MPWTTVTPPVSGTSISTSTFGTPVATDLNILGGVWTAYTPAWTASTTNPVLGNGTLTGRFIAAGKLIHFSILLTMGSTTTFGSGQYSLSLPVAAQAVQGTINAGVWFNDNSASANNSGSVNIATSTTIRLITPTAVATPTVPWTWANLDVIAVSGSYESA